jgi:hypothetical protein
MLILGLIIGIAIGFFFKPQIEGFVVKVIRMIKDNRKKDETDKDSF